MQVQHISYRWQCEVGNCVLLQKGLVVFPPASLRGRHLNGGKMLNFLLI